MGALFGLGIDNALVEINNEEVPILDGSAKEFIEILKSCGLEKSKEPIKIIKIQKKISRHIWRFWYVFFLLFTSDYFRRRWYDCM